MQDEGREILYTDIEPFCVKWLQRLVDAGHLPRGECRQADIRSMDADELRSFTQVHLFCGIGGWPYALKLAGWPADRPVWTGSCPCQPFSNAGRRLATEDERHLWPSMFRLIKESCPSTVFGEQTASDGGREWLAAVRTDLEEVGYEVGAADLCAASEGADHIRQRLWWVADAHGKRQSEPRQHRAHARLHSSILFRQTDRLVDAFRRNAMPFLCDSHDGVSAGVAGMLLKGIGNAIVPQVGATFVDAYMQTKDTP